MKPLPLRVGVGLVVLTSPLPQVTNRFKSLFPQLSSLVDRLLYVHILPESTSWPPKSGYDSMDITDGTVIARWSNVASGIYSNGSSKPMLDLRLLLHGIKNSLTHNFSGLQTNHKIEAVFFDPSIQSDFTKDYMAACFNIDSTQIAPDSELKGVPLDIPKDSSNHSGSELEDELPKILPTDKVYENVVLGGTFDRIHAGHKILLTSSLLRCRNEITVGVTDGDNLMKRKTLPELIQPCQTRIENVREFLQDVDRSLNEYRVVPILDPFGPSTVDENLQLIVGSQETKRGCIKVNEVRGEKGLSLLDIHVIDLVDDESKDVSSPEEEKISSSSQRMRLLGQELKPPLKAWDPKTRPYIIGLTGGSCGGKTNISKYLETLGAGAINCDLLGHRAYAPGTSGYEKVIAAFGTDLISDDGSGTINRKKLGQKVFGKDNLCNMRKLDSIVWPEIWKLTEEEIEKYRKENKEVVIVDAAVLFQAGWKEKVNQVWVSIVDTDSAVQRIMQRDSKTEEEARQRLSNQMSNQTFVQEANVVFCSKWEVAYTRKQVDKAWYHLQNTYIKDATEFKTAQ